MEQAGRNSAAADIEHGRHHVATPGKFVIGIGRGVGGALLFALPMLMTMEMWQLGFTIDRWKLVLLLVLIVPLLFGLSDRIGFEETSNWKDAARDAIIAYGIGIAVAAGILGLMKLLTPDMPDTEIIGKIAVQTVPASIGALLGRSELGSGRSDADKEDAETGYGGELFMMAVGALFLNLNLAPTEEIIVIGYTMTPWHTLATVLLSIGLMHAFVYAVSFKGGHELSADTPWWHALIRFTLPGYVIALIISLYVLWTFGSIDGTSLAPAVTSTVVLAFPGAIGAAAARLIL